MHWFVAIVLALGLPGAAFAHVKWFASYDLLCPPRPVFAVFLGEYFALFCLAVGPLMFAVVLADRYLTRRQCVLHRQAAALTERLSAYFPGTLRLGVSGFLAAVFLYSGLYGGMILTPELRTDAEWIRWAQLGIALLVLIPRTAFLAGIGIIFLYGYAMYGILHLLDYPIFLGVALYLIIDSLYGKGRRELAHSLLRVMTAVTLLWAGIEKFAYPEWSFQLIQERPGMTLGLDPEFFMVAAGFVEFCAAYLLLTGMLSARAAALVLLGFFVSAILGFGVIDAIGHSLIILVLTIFTLSINAVALRFDAKGGITATAVRHTCFFFGALLVFMALYYGGHYLSYQSRGTFVLPL